MYHHASASVNGPARWTEGRHPRGRKHGVLHTAAAELLPVERHLEHNCVVFHQGIALDSHIRHQVLINCGARPRSDPEAPVGVWLPAGHRQVVHVDVAIDRDAQCTHAQDDLDRCPV